MLSPTINSKKPTLRSQSLSTVVTDNLDAIHKADEAFTESKNSRNMRPWRQQIHHVWHSLPQTNEHQKSAKVPSQDEKVLIKNKSTYTEFILAASN